MLTLLIAAFPESLTRVELAGQAGYSTIYWTLDALDTVGPPKSAGFVFNQLTRSGISTVLGARSPGYRALPVTKRPTA